MIRSILVGLDDSDFSAAAVDLGIKLAQQHDCVRLAGEVFGASECRLRAVQDA